MIRIKLAAIATAGALAIGGLIASTGTASANGQSSSEMAEPTSAGDCLYVLNTSGYRTTPARRDACVYGERGGLFYGVCLVRLQETNVDTYVSRLACNAAND